MTRCGTSCLRQVSIRRASFAIPIGVDIERFPLGDTAARQAARKDARRTGVRVRRRFVSEGRCRAGRRASSRRRSRAQTRSSPCSNRQEHASRTLFVLLTGPARGYVRRRARASADSLPARAARFTGRARAAPITHSTSTSSPHGRRAARRACSSRWRGRPARHDPGRPGAVSSSRTVRTACWPTSTTPTHSRPVCNECMTTATLHDVYVRPAARRPKRMPTSGSTRSGPSCCTASSREADGMKVDPGRVGRYSRAGWRWIRLLPPRRRRGLRVFYGHDRVPGPGEPVAGGSAKFQRLASRFPNDPTGFTVLYLGSTWLPRDLGPLLGLARRRSIPVVVNMDGVAYPGWAGERTEELNEPYRRALACSCARPVPERVLQVLGRRVPRRTARQLGDPPQRRRRESLHASGGNSAERARAAPRRRPDPGLPARSSGCARSPASSSPSPSRACSSPAASSRRPSRSSTSSACAAGSTSSVATPSARRLTSCAARTSCCTRRCRTRARVS